MKVADGYFTLRVPEMSDAVWAQVAELIGRTIYCKIPVLPPRRRVGSTGRTGGDSQNLGKRENSPGNLGRIARTGLFRRASSVHRRGDGRSAYQGARRVY